jgi:hypothetical protein
MKCDEKVQFLTVASAWSAADRLNDNLALMFSPVSVCWCHRHDSLHIGHISRSQRSRFAGTWKGSHQRQQLRREIDLFEAADRCLEHLL